MAMVMRVNYVHICVLCVLYVCQSSEGGFCDAPGLNADGSFHSFFLHDWQ